VGVVTFLAPEERAASRRRSRNATFVALSLGALLNGACAKLWGFPDLTLEQ